MSAPIEIFSYWAVQTSRRSASAAMASGPRRRRRGARCIWLRRLLRDLLPQASPLAAAFQHMERRS